MKTLDSAQIEVVAFDADDTLWVNETYYRDTEKLFYNLLKDYLNEQLAEEELFKTETENMDLYGYGIKAFMLSMMETAIKVSDSKIDLNTIKKILALGREQLAKPILLLPGAMEVLKALHGKYRIVMATKGDLLDQERKINRSGLKPYFDFIEIMSEKRVENYELLFKKLNVKPEKVVMIGNTLKSDVLPVVSMGGVGIHVPFITTWQHEKVDENKIDKSTYIEIKSLIEVLKIFNI